MVVALCEYSAVQFATVSAHQEVSICAICNTPCHDTEQSFVWRWNTQFFIPITFYFALCISDTAFKKYGLKLLSWLLLRVGSL